MRGFTLIEVVVSFAILSVLFALAIPSYSGFKTNQEVTQAAQTFKTNLRFAQSQAFGGVKLTSPTHCTTTLVGWYIQVVGGGYNIRYRCGVGAEAKVNAVYKAVTLPAGAALSSNAASGCNILFRPINQPVGLIKLNGDECALSGEVIFTLWKGSKAIDIKVRTTGDIYEAPGSTPTPTPLPTATPAPTLTPTPTPIPTVTPPPTPTPLPTATPTPTPVPTAIPTLTPTPTPTTYTILTTVFIDTNGNGFKDTGESGYLGATVARSGDGTGTTNTSGQYTFTSVATGSYTISLTVPTGYTNTTPTSVVSTVPPNGVANFGIKLAPTPTPVAPTPTPTPLPNCTTTPINCSSCGGAAYNSCSDNNGTQTCTLTGPSPCNQVSTTQSCTTFNCDTSLYDQCSGGTCGTTCTCWTPGGTAPNNGFYCTVPQSPDHYYCSSSEYCTSSNFKTSDGGPWPCAPIPTPTPTPITCLYSSLLNNGCFENQLASWDCPSDNAGQADPGSCSADSGTKYAGNYSGKVRNGSGSDSGFWWGTQLSQGGFSASSDENFCLSARVKKTNAGDDVRIALQRDGSLDDWWPQSELGVSNTTNWQQVRGTVNAWWGASTVQVFLRVYSVSTAWFDDVQITRGGC